MAIDCLVHVLLLWVLGATCGGWERSKIAFKSHHSQTLAKCLTFVLFSIASTKHNYKLLCVCVGDCSFNTAFFLFCCPNLLYERKLCYLTSVSFTIFFKLHSLERIGVYLTCQIKSNKQKTEARCGQSELSSSTVDPDVLIKTVPAIHGFVGTLSPQIGHGI